MRTTAIVCATALLLLSCAATVVLLAGVAGAATTGNVEPAVEKDSKPTGMPTYEGRNPGDTIWDPFVIDYVPFTDSGNTCPFINDYDESCPYTGSWAPDAVYRYDCVYPFLAVIDLCLSDYDTKVFVYENEYTPGYPYACNDDYPGCGPDGYRSYLMTPFTAGNTYYIVIDGYGGDCGDYELSLDGWVHCAMCEPGGPGETEPYCIDPVNDVWNGGCNSDPPVFDHLSPSDDTIYFCGTSGTYTVGSEHWRDTDWYQIDLTQESEITFRGIANFGLRIGFVDGREGCENVSSFYSYADAPVCYEAELSETLPPGTWWLWVGPSAFDGVYCGTEYNCELVGYSPATPVENVSWSTVKAIFR
jgi:hypothetical protein